MEIAGAPGLLISVLTRYAARRMLETNIAPTRRRAETGHDRRAVRTRERAWLTLVLPLSDSSKIPNSMLPVVPSRQGERMRRFLLRPTPSKVKLHHIPDDRPRARGTRAAVDSASPCKQYRRMSATARNSESERVPNRFLSNGRFLLPILPVGLDNG